MSKNYLKLNQANKLAGLPQPTVKAGIEFDVFDEKPITINGFTFAARRVEVTGHPTLPDWTGAFLYAKASEESAGFWVGDLWNYAEAQEGWREKLPQALADIGLDLKIQTIYNYGSVARKVKPAARKLAPSYSHAAAVADFSDEEQMELLEKAHAENMTVAELNQKKRELKRKAVLDGQTDLSGRYRVLYADPPWSYNNSGQINESDNYGRATRHYPTMTIDELLALPVQAHVHSSAVLFLWVPAPLIYYATEPDKGPDPYRLIREWGFEPKTGLVWDKVQHNFGSYVSVRHEHLIIATRGSCTPDVLVPMIDSVQTVRRTPTHSEKPEEFRRDVIERLYNKGPYLELFARGNHKGWKSFGNDARLWAKGA